MNKTTLYCFKRKKNKTNPLTVQEIDNKVEICLTSIKQLTELKINEKNWLFKFANF